MPLPHGVRPEVDTAEAGGVGTIPRGPDRQLKGSLVPKRNTWASKGRRTKTRQRGSLPVRRERGGEGGNVYSWDLGSPRQYMGSGAWTTTVSTLPWDPGISLVQVWVRILRPRRLDGWGRGCRSTRTLRSRRWEGTRERDLSSVCPT